MKPNPKKVEEIKNTKSSDNVNALRRFLGLVNSSSVELQMVWKSIIFNFCLIKSWSHDQSECTNIPHRNIEFLAEKSLGSI